MKKKKTKCYEIFKTELAYSKWSSLEREKKKLKEICGEKNNLFLAMDGSFEQKNVMIEMKFHFRDFGRVRVELIVR